MWQVGGPGHPVEEVEKEEGIVPEEEETSEEPSDDEFEDEGDDEDDEDEDEEK